eukprot:Blabericola_migrator_1__4768@NODE_250_length_10882_cov_193_783819_g211_i0_p3_GENE_NODE_250_length_10882_cov_193_783819_g211_i0NODE_250_length_10882_cov_193_783819_g211_i0_p3_ORF_typecomplete_len518_score83_99_NODE_250_length_10882_cov_193_783819_g211_i022523805
MAITMSTTKPPYQKLAYDHMKSLPHTICLFFLVAFVGTEDTTPSPITTSTATTITDDPNQHPPQFYPGHEAEMRTRPFEERAKGIPYNSWQTPAWRTMTYVTPDPDIRVVYDSRDPATADRVRRGLFRDLATTWNATDQMEADALRWSKTFRLVTQRFHQALADSHRLLLPPDQQNVSRKISAAVPGVPRSLRKTFVFFEALKAVVTLPQQLVMVIAGPGEPGDYVDLKGFLISIPYVVEELPISKMPVKIVVQMDPKYKQWGNRWLAANLTDAKAEYIALWDGDDFPSPYRWQWFDWILEVRPEIDLLLTGKEFVSFDDYKTATDNITRLMLDDANPPVNETWSKLTKLLITDFNATYMYNEPLAIMNSTYVSEYRVGSVFRIPLGTGWDAHFPQMYEATYEALNRSQDFTDEQVTQMKRELEWLDVCKTEDGAGPKWWDIYVADGWCTLRRPLLNMIHPPTLFSWGEDSTYNWMIAAAGMNYMHLVAPFLGWGPGVYFRWRNTTYWDEAWRSSLL